MADTSDRVDSGMTEQEYLAWCLESPRPADAKTDPMVFPDISKGVRQYCEALDAIAEIAGNSVKGGRGDPVDAQVDLNEDWRSFWKVAEDDATVDSSVPEGDDVEFKVPTATIYTQGVLRLSPEDQYRIQCDISPSMNFKNGRAFLENL